MSELEHIERRLDAIQKTQEQIMQCLNDLAVTLAGHNPHDWIDSLEVQKILRISTSTLYRRRKSGKIVPHLIGGSILYFAPEIYKMRDHYLK